MENLLHVYTGQGKGKSSAAFGVVMRALGRGQKVCVAQLLKGGIESGEYLFYEKLKNNSSLVWRKFGRDCFIKSETITQKDLELTREALDWSLLEAKKDINLLVMDELCVALFFNLLTWDEAKLFLEETLKKVNVVVTGRGAPQELIEMADLVTEMKEVKHPFQLGKKPVEGLDF